MLLTKQAPSELRVTACLLLTTSRPILPHHVSVLFNVCVAICLCCVTSVVVSMCCMAAVCLLIE